MNKYTQNYSRLLRAGLLSVASLAVASTASAATFSEDFTTDPGNWKSGGSTNVSGGTVNIGGGGFSKYAIAFDDSDGDTAGGVFSLSFDWAIDGSTFTDNSQQFYAGFGTSPGDGGSSQGNVDNGFIDNEISYGFRFSGVDFSNATDGTSITVRAGDGPGANALNDFSTSITRASATDIWEATFRIDVNVPGNSISYFVNGVSLGTTEATVKDIGGVWFKMDQGDSNAYFNIDNVSVVVPEPGNYALIAGMLGLVSVMVRRRR
ncbi:MAG: hypothetical protein ISQ75_06490 [Puniceicoccaceae bacterium]|nr:hypothetical protein [Puniceicoccaceae bacterium]